MEIFSEILVEGTKRTGGGGGGGGEGVEDSMFCGSSKEGTCRSWSISHSLVSYFQKLGM